jgi:pyruvate kinase
VRKTKIIATLGPATESEDMLRQMILAGVNVFRLNMSHARHDWVREVVVTIRELSDELLMPVAILMDTQGPAIRTGDLPEKIDLKKGDFFTFLPTGAKPSGPNEVETNYADLIDDLDVGYLVKVDNGVIEMIVREKSAKGLRCEVLTPGLMGNRRHINLPGVKVKLPALTDKDLADVAVGVECDVDYLALSFVREAEDITLLRRTLDAKGGGRIRIIAKIEDQFAVRNVARIIEVADGTMVARGDLGVECPFEELPIIQRRIVKKCVATRKPVIVATHILESMIHNPVPTRAEITDASNAVFEGADAIMLSGETTVGKYPLRCVDVLDRVAQRIERSGNVGYHADIRLEGPREQMLAAAVHLADSARADGMLILSPKGRMAQFCSALRPRVSPIFAVTDDVQVARQLAFHHSVYPLVLESAEDSHETLVRAEETVLGRGWIRRGAKLVVLSDEHLEGENCWNLQLREV